MNSLFDTGASAGQRRIALWAALGILLLALLAIPGAQTPLPPLPAFMPAFATAVIIIELITAYLLLGQFLHSGRFSGVLLFAAYLYSGLMVVPHLLVFPKVFAEAGLMGAGPQAATWLWVFWHGGFPVWVALYALVERFQPSYTIAYKQATPRRCRRRCAGGVWGARGELAGVACDGCSADHHSAGQLPLADQQRGGGGCSGGKSAGVALDAAYSAVLQSRPALVGGGHGCIVCRCGPGSDGRCTLLPGLVSGALQ
jgi:hypothetical protein